MKKKGETGSRGKMILTSGESNKRHGDEEEEVKEEENKGKLKKREGRGASERE